MIVAGRRQKLQVPESSVTARVGIGLLETRGYGLDVELHVRLPGMVRADAERLVELAHQVCPYSKPRAATSTCESSSRSRPLTGRCGEEA